jgi:hypothetical protein
MWSGEPVRTEYVEVKEQWDDVGGEQAGPPGAKQKTHESAVQSTFRDPSRLTDQVEAWDVILNNIELNALSVNGRRGSRGWMKGFLEGRSRRCRGRATVQYHLVRRRIQQARPVVFPDVWFLADLPTS